MKYCDHENLYVYGNSQCNVHSEVIDGPVNMEIKSDRP